MALFEDPNTFGPIGLHVEGLIRFSHVDDVGDGRTTMQPTFELLTHVHACAPVPGQVPKMVPHPLGEKIASESSAGTDTGNGQRLLKEIPIRLMFNSPENNLSVGYKAFCRATGQLVCAGDGNRAAQRVCDGGDSQCVECSGPDKCQFAQDAAVTCQLHVRLKVQVEGSDDPMAVFEFQSSGIHSYRTLATKLKTLRALYAGLRGLPLRLTSWAKSTQTSGYLPFYSANIELAQGISMVEAKTKMQAFNSTHSGIDFAQMEVAIEQMRNNSQFVLSGPETIVSCWTPASQILQKSQTNKAGATQSIADLIEKARGKEPEAAPDQAATMTVPGAGVTAQVGEVATPAPAPDATTIRVDAKRSPPVPPKPVREPVAPQVNGDNIQL
jgi:hypothetical protein